ncbi:MAG TPA: hypothetical protein VIR03_03860 [Candidatus Saccharimonadales bacterium]
MAYTNTPLSSPSIEQAHTPEQQARYEKYTTERKLAKAIGGSREILVEATTVFPFTLFPDTISIDRTQISIVHRSFIRVGEAISMRIEDVLNVEAIVGPFFGSLQIYTRFFNSEKPYHVHWLWRHDALRIKRILHGYLIAIKKHIDCSALSTQELARMLDELGRGTGATELR